MALFGKKRQEERERGESAELVVEAIRDGVMIVGGDGNIRLANPAAVTMIGRSREEIVGLNFMPNLRFTDKSGKIVEEGRNPILIALRTKKTTENRELEMIGAKDGQRTPVCILAIPIEAGGAVVTLRNIARELKEESERSEFISTASHEMRTPVASIEGYLGLALNPETATIDERAKTYLGKAHEASQHLGRLFADLLDVSRLDDGKIRPRTQPVEMTELVKSIADGHIPSVAKKGLSYAYNSSVRIDGSAKTISQLLYADLDPDFLREAVDNVIDNAVKYTPEGGAIGVDVRGDEHNVIISVKDTGMGIKPDDITHIFQKFYRVDNSDTRTIGGTGLGLYLVRQRVESMGGKVWAESEPGKGSTFILSFPRISADEFEKRKLAFVNNQNSVKWR